MNFVLQCTFKITNGLVCTKKILTTLNCYFHFPQIKQGVIDRNGVGNIGIDYQENDTLDILVENQGHINFMLLNDPKGIIQNVTLNGVILANWTIFPLSFDPGDIAIILNTSKVLDSPSDASGAVSFYVGSIPAMPDGKPPLDTFLYLKNWSKVRYS